MSLIAHQEAITTPFRVVTGGDLVQGLSRALSLGVDFAYITIPDGELLRTATRSLPVACSDWQRRQAILELVIGGSLRVPAVVHVSDDSLGSVMAIVKTIGRVPSSVVAWARLYSPGNKPSEWVDPGTDWLLGFDDSKTSSPRVEYLSAAVGGKAEDGRRELNRAVLDPPADVIARPAALADWLLDRWRPSLLLEAPVDAGGLSVAARQRGIDAVGVDARGEARFLSMLETRLGALESINSADVAVELTRASARNRSRVPPMNKVAETSFAITLPEEADAILGEDVAWVDGAALPGLASALAPGDAVAVIGPSLLREDDDATATLFGVSSVFGRIVLIGSTHEVLRARGALAVASTSEYRGMVLEESGAVRAAAFFRAPGASRKAVYYRQARTQPLKNDDGDPRGLYRVTGHKGARSIGKLFPYVAPPYRWRLPKGPLPPGMWRLNETSGALFAKELTAPGEYSFEVEVEDADGCTTTAKVTMAVVAQPVESMAAQTWLSKPPDGDGDLRVTSKELPTGSVGTAYAWVLSAAGGHPYESNPFYPAGGRRGWEYSLSTLEKHIASDAVFFPAPKDGKASPPSIKTWPGGAVATKQPAVLGRIQDTQTDEEFLEAVRSFVHANRLVLVGPEFRGHVSGGLGLRRVARAEAPRDRAVTQLVRDGFWPSDQPWSGSGPVIAWGRRDTSIALVLEPGVIAGRAISESVVAGFDRSALGLARSSRVAVAAFAIGPDARAIRLVTEE